MQIFVTGVSGYIGGSVAARLIDAGQRVAGLVRSAERAEQVRALGIEPVLGSLDDADVLAAAARRADAVVNAANSDHRGSVETLVGALTDSGKMLLHTSGSSIVSKDSRGERSNEIYTEDTPLDPAPEKAARVAIDRYVRDAAMRGVRSVVLCNTLIYGRGLGLHKDSIQIPTLVAQARRSSIARHIGRGLNLWSNVHIEDVTDLYLLALERAPAGSFYFVENGEASYRDMAAAIAAALQLGPPQSWDPQEAVAELGVQRALFSLGSNSRVRAKRARQELGWAPKHSSVIDWIHHEYGTAGHS